VFALAGILATLLLWPARSLAEEEVTLRQGNPGSATYWEPIISDLYLVGEQTPRIPLAERREEPAAFSGENLINPKPHFTLMPPVGDQSPNLLTDWRTLQQRIFQENDPVSAWFVSRQFPAWEGRPRLLVHKVLDEERLVGYEQSVRYHIHFDLDIPHERLPGLQGLTGPARRQKLFQGVKAVEGTLTISRLDGVSLRGRGGTLVDPPEVALNIMQPGETLERFLNPQDPFVIPYILNAPTAVEGDRLNGVVNVALNFVLEVGPELGIDPPEQKTVRGEIRVAIGKRYVDFIRVGYESEGRSR
jgi:hypothetical protein